MVTVTQFSGRGELGVSLTASAENTVDAVTALVTAHVALDGIESDDAPLCETKQFTQEGVEKFVERFFIGADNLEGTVDIIDRDGDVCCLYVNDSFETPTDCLQGLRDGLSRSLSIFLGIKEEA